jgi:ligand-binding sensor domain-containing protein
MVAMMFGIYQTHFGTPYFVHQHRTIRERDDTRIAASHTSEMIVIARRTAARVIVCAGLACTVLLLPACAAPAKDPRSSSARLLDSLDGEYVREVDNNIMVVFQDRQNTLWMGSWRNGLYVFDGDSIRHITEKHGLSSNRVEEIKEDTAGNVFVNTSNGLHRVVDGKLRRLTPDNFGVSIWRLQPQDVWFKHGGREGHVLRYDGTTLTSLRLPPAELPSDVVKKSWVAADPYGVYTLYKDSHNCWWFGTAALGVCRLDSTGVWWIHEPDLTELHDGPANGIRSIVEDRDGKFWFTAEYTYQIQSPRRYSKTRGIGPLRGASYPQTLEYLSSARGPDGSLWFATYRDGVFRYDGRTVKHYPVQWNNEDVNVFCVYIDRQGVPLVGTHEHGIYRLKDEVFQRFLTR